MRRADEQTIGSRQSSRRAFRLSTWTQQPKNILCNQRKRFGPRILLGIVMNHDNKIQQDTTNSTFLLSSWAPHPSTASNHWKHLRLLRGIAEEAAPMIDKRLSGARKNPFSAQSWRLWSQKCCRKTKQKKTTPHRLPCKKVFKKRWFSSALSASMFRVLDFGAVPFRPQPVAGPSRHDPRCLTCPQKTAMAFCGPP